MSSPAMLILEAARRILMVLGRRDS